MKRLTPITTLSFLFILLFLFSGAAAKQFTFEFHKEVPVGKNPTLFLSNISGKIIIKSHSEGEITIDAFKVIKTRSLEKAEDLADQINIEIKKDGEEVDIQTEYPRGVFRRGISCWVNYEISVPPETRLNIKTTSADVKVEDIQEKVRINTVSGDVEVESIKGGIDFSSVSGDFYLLDIRGDLLLEGTSSDMKLERIKGDVRIDCVSGDLILQEISGDIEASTSSGDMEVEQSQGELDLITISGDVEVRTEISAEGEYTIETTSGEVTLHIPEDSNARLKCESQSGSISARIPLKVLSTSRRYVEGELGSGGSSRIFLSTLSGDINVSGY
jgi:DUF4097 and DUF4098 domain-containing protein YvlB